MKRELKVKCGTVEEWLVQLIARLIPMKRELKVNRITFKRLLD